MPVNFESFGQWWAVVGRLLDVKRTVAETVWQAGFDAPGKCSTRGCATCGLLIVDPASTPMVSKGRCSTMRGHGLCNQPTFTTERGVECPECGLLIPQTQTLGEIARDAAGEPWSYAHEYPNPDTRGGTHFRLNGDMATALPLSGRPAYLMTLAHWETVAAAVKAAVVKAAPVLPPPAPPTPPDSPFITVSNHKLIKLRKDTIVRAEISGGRLSLYGVTDENLCTPFSVDCATTELVTYLGLEGQLSPDDVYAIQQFTAQFPPTPRCRYCLARAGELHRPSCHRQGTVTIDSL